MAYFLVGLGSCRSQHTFPYGDEGGLIVYAFACVCVCVTRQCVCAYVHLEKFWRISLYVTDDAIAKLSV